MSDPPEEQPQLDENGIPYLRHPICFPCDCWGRRPRKRGRECDTPTPAVIYIGPDKAEATPR